MEYKKTLYVKTSPQRLVNVNITKETLTGALDLIGSYRKQKTYTDSLIPALKASNGSLKNQIAIHIEKDTVNQENIAFLEKNLKVQKRKNVGNTILLTTFAISSAALMLLYLTK